MKRKRRKIRLFTEKNHAAREIAGPEYRPSCPGCPSTPWSACPCYPGEVGAAERANQEADHRFEHLLDRLTV